jgi:hypothetical protein
MEQTTAGKQVVRSKSKTAALAALVTTTLLFMALVMAAAPAGAATQPAVAAASAAHLIGTQNTQWAGYVATGSFTSSQATFVVPTLSCTAADVGSTNIVTIWDGLDGATNSPYTVEQDGIDESCSGVGQPVFYSGWWEMYNVPGIVNNGYPDMHIQAGDTITAGVSYSNGWFTLRLVNDSKGIVGQVQEYQPTLLRTSAECVIENNGGGQYPLPPFGSANFSECTTNGKPIGAQPSQPYIINGAHLSDGTPTGAYPTPLTNGTAFSVIQGTKPPVEADQPIGGQVVGIAAQPSGIGYWLANAQGAVVSRGNAVNYGSMAGQTLNSPIAHIVSTPDGSGYWLVAADGGTFAFGDAGFYGSMGGQHLNAPVVDIAPTPDGKGYWLVASDGGIFAFGDAQFHGSMGGQHLNQPIVGISTDNATDGYYLVASDGGIFAFGAPFFGSTGSAHLNQPIIGLTTTPDGQGYWFVASDGGLFAFGDAAFYGSMGGQPLSAPIVGMTTDNASGGYWMAGADGTVYNFHTATYGDGF